MIGSFSLGYGVEPDFWRSFIVFFIILAIVFIAFDLLLRRLLKVKQKLFSSQYVNSKHEKIHWTIVAITLFLMFTGAFYNGSRHPDHHIIFLEPRFLLLAFFLIAGLLQVYMEWRYATDRKKYIHTLSVLVFAAIVMAVLFSTDFLGFFSAQNEPMLY